MHQQNGPLLWPLSSTSPFSEAFKKQAGEVTTSKQATQPATIFTE
jgi:hypothetical protein